MAKKKASRRTYKGDDLTKKKQDRTRDGSKYERWENSGARPKRKKK